MTCRLTSAKGAGLCIFERVYSKKVSTVHIHAAVLGPRHASSMRKQALPYALASGFCWVETYCMMLSILPLWYAFASAVWCMQPT
jgi:hypothetical protein